MQTNAQSGARLNSGDIRALALWLLAGVLGAAFAFQYFFIAFPEASVDFRVTREEAVARAQKFLNDQGHLVSDYQSSVVFSVDNNAKTYLEREVGLEVANRLTAGDVIIWWWDVRFFLPQQQEEFRVAVDPSGRVVGTRHVVEEARAGAKLESEAARALAEALLREHIKLDLAGYTYLPGEANPTERPNRRDWSFTWERRVATLEQLKKDAPYHVRVTVKGDKADGYQEFLKVPEAWERDYEKLRSSNTFFQLVAQVPYAFLMGAVFLVLFDLARRGLVQWHGALKLGLVLAALFFVMNVNEWPLTRHGYDTNSSYEGFLVQSLAMAALASVALALLATLSVASGEPLYRGDHPNKLLLGAAFTRRSWREGVQSKEFFMASVIGLAMAAAHIGFVVAFYLLGKDIGFWAPQEIKYTDAVSTALPWIYPLAISLYAATSEEFMFRLFAIPLLLRLTKSKWVAVIVPAFIWGFLHSAYPQQPGWVRGVEVGFIGIVAGWVMLRWGILATLIWHYTVDALLIGLFLLRSENFYFQVSGYVVVALTLFPLLFAAGAYAVRRRFADDEALFNRSEPLVEKEKEAPAAAVPLRRAQYEPLTQGIMALVIGLGVLGIAAAYWMQPQRLGDYARFSVNLKQAEERADQVLRDRGVDPQRYRRASLVIDTFDGVKSEYLRRAVGLKETNRIYEHRVPSIFWQVRYFRPEEKEEYRIILKPDGGLHSIHHEMEESAEGANLTKEEAQARAEAWLRDEKKIDLAQWKLVTSESKKETKRIDHTLTWEEIAPLASLPGAGGNSEGDNAAHVRMESRVKGDEVSGYRVFVKIPEEWERRQTEETLPRILHFVYLLAFFGVVVVTVLVVFFKNLKQVTVPWRRLARWALWAPLAAVVSYAVSYPKQIALVYQTEWPWNFLLSILLISQFFGVALAYSGVILLLGLGWFFLARAFGEERLPSWRGMPATYYRDALLLALGGTGALLLLGRASALVSRAWPTDAPALGAQSPQTFDTLLPAAFLVSGAVTWPLFAVGLVAIAAGFVAWLGRATESSALNRALQALLLIALAFAMMSAWGSPADLAKKFLLQLVTLAVLAFGVARVFRFNMLAYFLLAALGTLLSGAVESLRQPETFLRLNGYVVAGAAALLLAWPLLGWLRAKPQDADNGISTGGEYPLG